MNRREVQRNDTEAAGGGDTDEGDGRCGGSHARQAGVNGCVAHA